MMRSSSGPQFERNRQLWDEKAEIPGVQRSDLVVNVNDHNDDKRAYEGELLRMKRENEFIKDQLQRSFRELKAFQIKYPSAYSPTEVEDNLPPWITDPKLMNPVITAYDSKLRELEYHLGQQSVQCESLREKVDSVVAENDELRQAQLEQLSAQADTHLGPMGPMAAALLAESDEKLEILMEANARMVEQKASLTVSIEETQEELAARTKELSAVVQHLTTADKELASVTIRLVQAEKDRAEAAAQTAGFSEELGSARSTIDSMREQLSSWQQKYSEVEIGIRDLKKQLISTAAQAEENNLLNMRRTKSAEDRVRDLHSLLLQKTQELDTSVEVGRKLRREYNSTRQDAEGMLQVMGGLERQVADYQEREDEVQRLARESKQQVEDALSLKDQACAREDHGQREVARLHEERGALMLKRQADIDAATEATRQRAAAQRRGYEEDMKDMSLKNAELIAVTEKALRDALSGKEMLDRFNKTRENERKAVETHMTDLEDRIHKVTIVLEEERARKAEVQELNKDLRSTIDKLRTQMDLLKAHQQQHDKSRDLELQSLKGPHREAQRQLIDKSRELSKKSRELEELKGANSVYLASLEKRYIDETALYKKRSADAIFLKEEMEMFRLQGDQQAKLVVDEIKSRSLSTQKLLENRLREEVEVTRRLGVKNKDTDAALREASEERGAYLSLLEEARFSISHLQDELTDARGSIADLTSQLSSSYDARANTARLIKDMDTGRAFDEYKDRDYLDSIIGSRSRRNESEKESSRRSPDGREKEELDVSF